AALRPPFRKKREGWGTRPDQIPHFSQKRREMGHPAAPRPPFRKSAKGWGTRPDQIPHFSQKRREMGHPYVLSFPRLEFPRLAKPARNGAPERIEFPTSRKSGEKWGTQLHLAHPFAKSAKDGAPARIKFPTSRKSGEKWGTPMS